MRNVAALLLISAALAACTALRPGAGRQATEPAAPTSDDDAYYAQFKVPDDLIW